MEAKLAKMKQRLEKAAEAQAEQAPIQSDSESSDEEAPALEQQPPSVLDTPAKGLDVAKLRPLDEAPPADEPKPAELVFAVAVDHPYYEQNRMLVNMGFVNERNNMNVLASCDGNLQRAITTLVEKASL